MAGVKRKEAPKAVAAVRSGSEKKQKLASTGSSKKRAAPIKEPTPESDESSDNDEDEDELDGEDSAMSGVEQEGGNSESDDKKIRTGQSSAEAHAAQRALAKERKAAKPNADIIGRSKKIWERLRRKSHVPNDERKALVAELFEIITGRVRDFVFKHDSVRVIQCALKYANMQQRKQIVTELRTDMRELAESKYGKFLVAKMVVEGDAEIRNMVVPQFYGHVRRLINHPEAAWIVDDIYRQVATSSQKALMLREWYGAEYAIFGKTKAAQGQTDDKVTADLKAILDESPEKKKPMMNYLQQLINQLVQKKMTGFTMLHDAMLQYFLNTTPGTPEAAEFLELLKSDLDEENGGDLLKNLAFTKNGSRVVCLALGYGTAKDRKLILRVYKDAVEMMALDPNAHTVLLAAMDTVDDTKMTAKALFPELLGENIKDEAERENRLVDLISHLTARIPLLYPLAGQAKWLVSDVQKNIIAEVQSVREVTSKKNPEIRRSELIAYMSPYLLPIIQSRAADLASVGFGCQYISEVLLEAQGDKKAACEAVVALTEGDVTSEGHIAQSAAGGKMLRALVSGGKFDPETKTVKLVEPRLGFGDMLFKSLKGRFVEWATSPSSFVVVQLLESEDVSDSNKKVVRDELSKGKKTLEKAAKGENAPSKKAPVESDDQQSKKKKKTNDGPKGNAGAKILLEKLSK
ncbi:ARM repeat-containing protein, partial [Aureobasidium melanogenum]